MAAVCGVAVYSGTVSLDKEKENGINRIKHLHDQ